MSKRKRKVTIDLPDEFLKLCEFDRTDPLRVMRGFIGDLCHIISCQSEPRLDGYNSNGSDEREFARTYYDRVGYPYEGKSLRENSLPNEIGPHRLAGNHHD